MRQVLFTLFGYDFHAYATFLSVAFIACTLLTVREGEKRGLQLPPEGGLWVFVGALIGAKVFWYLQYDPQWYRHIWRAVLIWQAGLVYYGGLLGGMAGAYLFTTVRKLPRLKTADVVVPYLALGQAITRLGCFLNGCCYGKPSSLPWALQFPRGSHAWQHQIEEKLITEAAPTSLAVHPTQLYMVAGLVVIALVLKHALNRSRFDGQTALLYGLFYGILRFVVEIVRGDVAHSVFGMTVSQTLSLALFLFSLTLLLAVPIVRRSLQPAPRTGAATSENEGPAPEAGDSDKP